MHLAVLQTGKLLHCQFRGGIGGGANGECQQHFVGVEAGVLVA